MSTEGGNMLINLHVKNLALIKEADVDFSKGLSRKVITFRLC